MLFVKEPFTQTLCFGISRDVIPILLGCMDRSIFYNCCKCRCGSGTSTNGGAVSSLEIQQLL